MISKLEEKFNEQHILAYDGSVVINNHIHRGYINWPLDGDHFMNTSFPATFDRNGLIKHLEELWEVYGDSDREFWWLEELEVYDFDKLNFPLFPHLRVLKDFFTSKKAFDRFYIYTHNWVDRFKEFKTKRLCNFLSFQDKEVGYTIPSPIRKMAKHFLYLNRKNRTHRELLFNRLKDSHVLDKSYYSYRAYDDGKLPSAVTIKGSITTPDCFYTRTSFCQIVAETQFFNSHPYYGETVFITEKVDKAIRFAQPFIILSSENYLKTLKELGFKTFDKWWDESYDNETDWSKRLDKVEEVIKYISTWSLDKVHRTYKEMIPILIHNQQVRHAITEFKIENYLMSEDTLPLNRFCDYDQLKLFLKNLHHF